MSTRIAIALTISAFLSLAGCASPDTVVFVTKTSIGIDFDSKPATASIAYDRIEGYIGPRYDNGEIPPVVASIKSDGNIFNPKIHQIYATGEAAEIAVSADQAKSFTEATKSKNKLKGNKKLMFFGTTTTTGMKVGFTTSLPDSIVFGFKRKEYSFIPLGIGEEIITRDGVTVAEKFDIYPAVIASIDTAAASQTNAPELTNVQFFATGFAALELAAKPEIGQAFAEQATRALSIEVPYGADETTARIRSWLNEDQGATPPSPTHGNMLNEWLKSHGAPKINRYILMIGEYRELRLKAIEELSIP